MRLFRKKIQFWITILILPAIVISCISTRSFLIEIPIPSRKDLPENIQSLLLVNRTVDERYNNVKEDSLQQIFYEKNFKYDTVIYDIQAADTLLKAMGELLFESGRFDYVIPENRFLDFEKNAFLTTEMPWDEVRQLCDTFQTDAILSVDHYAARVSVNYDKESFLSSAITGEFITDYMVEMKVMYEALFRVYDPLPERVVYRELFRDTLFWYNEDPSLSRVFERFTTVKQALTEASIAIALDLSDKIGTTWLTGRRNFYVKGDSNFSRATSYVNQGDWESAMTLWKETAEKTSSKSLKSKAQFNIAVGYELMGELNEAVKWALDSYNTMYRLLTYEYLEELKNRKKEKNNQL